MQAAHLRQTKLIMSQRIEPSVNINVVSILTRDTHTNKVVVSYEPIQKPLEQEFQSVLQMASQPNILAKDILGFVINNPRLNVLLNTFSYCDCLSSAFQGIYSRQAELVVKYSSVFSTESDIERQKQDEKNCLVKDLQKRLSAYYLELTYQICESKRLAGQVFAYSHRKVGWSNPPYNNFDNNFSIEVKTNFGYGSVSYFYTRMRYKNIDVVPFSDWVLYRYAGAFDIVSYSSRHPLYNGSWIDAMQYLSDAYNLSIQDEEAFIEKYIIEECEKLVSGLEHIFQSNNFQFLDSEKFNDAEENQYRSSYNKKVRFIYTEWKRFYVDEHKEGHNLIEFRGQKISGALAFVSNIMQLNEIIETNSFIQRIENCNRTLQPILTQEIEQIKIELREFNEQMKVLKPKYDNYLDRHEIYSKKLTEFTGQLNQTYDLENQFSVINTEYPRFKQEFEQISKEFSHLYSKILSLETTQRNIEIYQLIIQNYFNKKTTNV